MGGGAVREHEMNRKKIWDKKDTNDTLMTGVEDNEIK